MYIESPIIIVDYNHNIFIVMAKVVTIVNLDFNMFITQAIWQSVKLVKDETEGEGSIPLASLYPQV